jgi:hypothetical protein
MPGDYLFPKKLFKANEPLDTTEINDALQTVAERLNGHLGPHNIRAPLAPELSSEAGTFFRTKTAVVDVDPLMENAVGSSDGLSPQPGAPGSFLLEQQTGWQIVAGASTDMRVDVQTGASALSITASAAHCFAGDVTNRYALYFVDVPLFTNNPPDREELSNNGRNNPALVGVDVTLESTTYTIEALEVQDIREDGSFLDQSRDVARRIVAASPSESSDDIATLGWVPVTNYAVKAEGRRLFFRRQSPGAVPGSSTFEIVFRYKLGGDASRTQVTTRAMTQGSSGAATGAAVAQSFSSLESCKPFAASPQVVVYFPAQIQYALRVDGVVITETITGRFDNEQAPLTPARIVDPRKEDAVIDGGGSPVNGGISGPLLGRSRERPDAINIPMFSVRLTASVDVEPGDHVVELVVRRVPMGRRRSFTPPPPEVGAPSSSAQYLPSRNRVYIYSRQLAVTDVPIEPVGSALFGDPSVVASYSDEDVVTKKSLVDQRLQKVANETNDLQSFQVARGAINGDHLQGFSSVIAAGAESLAGVTSLNSSAHAYEYPSGAPETFGLERVFYPVPASWRQMASATLSVDASPPVECVLTVEGNVFIERLVHSSLTQDKMHLGAACFLIAVRQSRTSEWYAWRPSLAWVNSNNYIAYQNGKTSDNLYPPGNKVGLNYQSRYGLGGGNTVTSGDLPGDFVDVPVTAYVDFSGAVLTGGSATRALGVSIDQVAIFGAAAWMGPAGSETRVRCRHSTINAVVMKS